MLIIKQISKRSHELNQARSGKIAIFANDYIGIQINQYGFFEKSVLDMVFAFLDPILADLKHGVAIDVGANIGNHSIYFSPYFTSVLAFEPHPQIYDLLLFNSKTVANIVAFNLGLGETSESLEMYENWENMGSASIKYNWTADGGKVEVKIDRLDDIKLDFEFISFMKIDVEGFEASVIRGAQKTIREHQPLILMEQLKSEFVDGSTESIQFLHEQGYVFCWHEPWATSRGWLERRINTLRNILLGSTYDYNFITGSLPPPATYDMLIAVPQRFQTQLLNR